MTEFPSLQTIGGFLVENFVELILASAAIHGFAAGAERMAKGRKFAKPVEWFSLRLLMLATTVTVAWFILLAIAFAHNLLAVAPWLAVLIAVGVAFWIAREAWIQWRKTI